MSKIRKTYEFSGQTLFLCDMRPGFSEDGIECTLPAGSYELTLETTESGGRGFILLLAGEIYDGQAEHAVVPLDMARIGVLDRKAFLKIFSGDWETLYDWSESAADTQKSEWGGFLRHKDSGLSAFFVNTGMDGECAVQLLRLGKKTVGVRAIPQPPVEKPSKSGKLRQWTQVEVRCSGIADPWGFCDDWNFQPEVEEILENVVLEVSSVDEGDSLKFLDSDDIDPDTAIANYQPGFKGVTGFNVYLDKNEEDPVPLSIPESFALPKLEAQATSRELAEVLFDIFQKARSWA